MENQGGGESKQPGRKTRLRIFDKLKDPSKNARVYGQRISNKQGDTLIVFRFFIRKAHQFEQRGTANGFAPTLGT